MVRFRGGFAVGGAATNVERMRMKNLVGWLVGCLVVLGHVVPAFSDDFFLTPRRTGNPGYTYHPSPADWRDVNMYQLFTDRFSDGNPANNNSRGWYSNGSGNRHFAMGGDWKGVRNKLDYLQGMGVNAVWISGVQINEQGSDTRYTPYHAYHPTDFYRVEPMFGTFQELKELIDDAHSRGIYVIIDVVINHMADLSGLGDGKDGTYHPFGGGNLFWWNGGKKHAWPLDNLAYFHNNGKIINWSDSWQILNGAFVGTDDLKTSDSFVQNHLLAAFKNLIDATDCDGFRVDAIKHVEKPFLMSWADSMRKHAASLGKNNFILFGENFTYDDNAVAEHCKDQGYAFNSALYFPMQLTMKEVFAYEQATRKLQDRLNNLHLYGEGAQNLVTFMDNHDVDRIALECGSEWQTKLKPALTFLYTGTPVPCLFYGTEHGFNQGGQRNNGLEDGDYQREVMFNYGYQPGNAWGDKFNASDLYNYIKKLNEFRRDYPCLTRGNMVNRWKDDSNKGLFAYTRTLGDQEALVVFNTDWNTKTLSPSVGKPDGTVFVNLFNPTETVTVSGGKLNNISVGSKGSKIFFAGTSKADVKTFCSRTATTITYTPNKGPLENAVSNIVIGIKPDNNASGITEHVMTRDGGSYTFSYAASNATNAIVFWFRDQGNPPTYDNNDGQDYALTVKDCWKTGINLQFVGHISHWPVDGELDVDEDLWIDVQTWPKRSAFAGMVVYSADGGVSWLATNVAPNGEVGNNDAWHVNLGSFPRGAVIEYAVMMEGENGEVWNSNGGTNYRTRVNSNVIPILWMGNTYHWPTNGAINNIDDLWINVETYPVNAAVDAVVVYSTDGGSNWLSGQLSKHMSTNNNDFWHINLGKMPAGSTVRYALAAVDGDGLSSWDNNNGLDFLAVVNESGSSVQWFGNARHFGAPLPDIKPGISGIGRFHLILDDLENGVQYRVMQSVDMINWTDVEQFTGVFPSQVSEPTNNSSFASYCVQILRGPSDQVRGAQAALVTTETWPAGGATAVNIVYSPDNGATWMARPMVFTGTHDNNDIWTVNLGEYPSGTVIKYAIEVVDGGAQSVWDNNAGQDYQISVVP